MIAMTRARALLLCVLPAAGLLTACGDDDNKPELLDKLRAIGAVLNPVVATPSADPAAPSTVDVSLLATVPKDATVTVEPFEDEASSFAVKLTADQIQVTGENYDDSFEGLRLYTATARLTVPSAAVLTGREAVQVRYGLELKSGGESEQVIGNFLVYSPDKKPDWQNPTVEIARPAADQVLAAGQKVDIEASVTNPNGEELKYGWFVTGGEISNRRARQTKWKTPGAGRYTLIMTVRGKKSRGFAYRAMTVEVK